MASHSRRKNRTVPALSPTGELRERTLTPIILGSRRGDENGDFGCITHGATSPELTDLFDTSTKHSAASHATASQPLSFSSGWETEADDHLPRMDHQPSIHLILSSSNVSETPSIFDESGSPRRQKCQAIVSRAAAEISRLDGLQEMLEWLADTSKSFWGPDVRLELCLKPGFGPTSSKIDHVFSSTSVAEEAREALRCISLDMWMHLKQSISNPASLPQLQRWSILFLDEHPALRLCFRSAEKVVRRADVSHGWWNKVKTSQNQEETALGTVLYMPIRGHQECIGVLRLSSHQGFEVSDQQSFVPIVELLGSHLQVMHLQKTLVSDRMRHRALSKSYRLLLDDMLPAHVVDKLCSSKYNDHKEHIEEKGASRLMPTLLTSNPAHKIPATPSRPLSAQILNQLNKVAYAEFHECVAILFSDIKGFTSLSQVADPAEIMLMLNELFGLFDDIVENHSPLAYKVETIGDAYMIAFGLFGQTCNEEGQAAEVAMKAIQVGAEMVQASRTVLMPGQEQMSPVQIRVGVHMGQIMSGIVGKKVPRYCMFGDTVNTASRMESTGEPGMLHVTQRVQQACAHREEPLNLEFESTGGKDVKGKGFMSTFLLKPDAVLAAMNGEPAMHGKVHSRDALPAQAALESGPKQAIFGASCCFSALLPRVADYTRRAGSLCSEL